MKQYRVVGLLSLLFMTVFLSSCINSINPSNNKGYQDLDESILSEKIYNNGLSLSKVIDYLNLSKEMLIRDNNDSIELLQSGGRGNEFYEEYKSTKQDMYFICYKTGGVKYIELDSDKFALKGINKLSNFKEVQNVLGENTIQIVEDALPGLRKYEIVYKYDDVYFRIYAFDAKGNSGLYFCITNELKSKYGYYEITVERINNFFRMTKEEIKNELGEGDESYFNQIRYDKYGIVFEFSEEGTKLVKLYLSGYYQISGLRQNMTIEKTIKIIGEGDRIETITSEDGPLTTLEYNYENFVLDVCYLLMEDQVPWWDIKSRD